MKYEEDDQTYQRLKPNCRCGCYAHCGHSCLTDDCDCNECRCSDCLDDIQSDQLTIDK